jgi:DNA processing protein
LLLLIAADRATVAVLAGGVDRAYPAKHATLLERIVATGRVVESPWPRVPRTRSGRH